MLAFSMLSQGLSVVASEHDEGVFVELELAEASKETSKLGVVEGDFAVIQVAGVAAEVRLGRTIRAVRIVEMHP